MALLENSTCISVQIQKKFYIHFEVKVLSYRKNVCTNNSL